MFNSRPSLALMLPPFDDADDGDARDLAREAFFEAAEAESARAHTELCDACGKISRSLADFLVDVEGEP